MKKELYDEALGYFTRYLKDNNLKMTRERRLILKEMIAADSHLEAEDLLKRFKRKKENVSRATIYRTFDLLLKARLITKSDFGHNHFHYEHTLGTHHHDHLICNESGKILEFIDTRLEKLLVDICKKHNFTMSSRSIQLFGRYDGKNK